jgi:hypothetical protein
MSDVLSVDVLIANKLKKIYKGCDENKDGCLIFQGSRNNRGYGRYHLTYPRWGTVNTTVHRAVYILEKRSPELIRDHDKGEISHLCGMKLCVQIKHLRLESGSDNMHRHSCHKDEKSYLGCHPPCVIPRPTPRPPVSEK